MADFEKVTRGLEWCIRHGSMGGHDCYGYFAYDQNSNACIGRVGDYYKNCPYRDCETGCAVTLARDAIFLLKEQEPRVIAYSEIEKHPLVWLEGNDKEDVIPALFLQYNGWSAEFAVQASDKYVDTIVRSAKVIADERMYGVTWRAWTSHPTPEQRKAVKWDG